MRTERLRAAALLAAATMLAAACNGRAVLVETREVAAGSGETTGAEAPPPGAEASLTPGAPAPGAPAPGDPGAAPPPGGPAPAGPQPGPGPAGPAPAPGAPRPAPRPGGGGAVSQGGGVNLGPAPGGQSSAQKCATTSNPEQGFTADTLKIGTILPLTGASRPLGEQTARAMQASIEQIMNRQDSLGGAYAGLNWGCPDRPGMYGRRVELEIYSLQNSTPEEALAGMRRLIDAEKVFLVRDCYLVDELMGAAARYQNERGVPSVWCYYSEDPLPGLAPWSFAPGVSPLVQTAINTAFPIRNEGRKSLAILADPTHERNLVPVVRRVAEHLGQPIPEACIVYKRIQEASAGMRSEVTKLRTCRGVGAPTDMVVALDGVLATFGALEAQNQGWRPADARVHWTCTGTSCWANVLAEICGTACESMTTNCSSLPCIPWADPQRYPAVQLFRDIHRRYLSQEPEDILTYAPMAITASNAVFYATIGPDLSREKVRQTLTSLRDWNFGIGPVLNTSEQDHFGGRATWIIKFTGGPPFYDDVTGGFLTLDDVGVPQSVVTG